MSRIPTVSVSRLARGAFLALTFVCGLWGRAECWAAPAKFLSHPPMRPLPVASQRPLATGESRFVHPTLGNDDNPGTADRPWRTLLASSRKLQPGTTLYLRGGLYYERVPLTQSGTAEQPITIRSYPGEIAILDGGLREFHDDPAGSWKPAEGGAPGEFVSTKTYFQFDDRKTPVHFLSNAWEPMHGLEEQRPLALGNFADSLVPLHGYRALADLRATSEFRVKKGETGVYCGPGLWFNRQTGRIHCRLAHTQLAGLGESAYKGETDPRKLPLVIACGYGDDVLRITGLKHVRVYDLVFRGAQGSSMINVYGSDGVEFDGLTVYGGAPGMLLAASSNIRLANSAFRSLCAPWSSRSATKYWGTASYIISTLNSQPENHNFELAHNEFTDGHDFGWFRYVKNLKFHHNFVDNFNDDGFEVGAKKRNHELYVFQNVFSRCYMTFTLHEMEKDESPATVNAHSGVYIYRNLIDLRGGIYSSPPTEPDPSGKFLHEECRLCSDHGGPIWPHYYFYHNTLVEAAKPWRDHYGAGIGNRGISGNQRWIFNNIFVSIRDLPGQTLTAVPGYQIDGNLHWSPSANAAAAETFLSKFRKSKFFEQTKEAYSPGWTARDQFADPKFFRLNPDFGGGDDLRLQQGSPALNAGVAIPKEWPDPLRDGDEGQPDLGAIPHGTNTWPVGVQGRLSAIPLRHENK